jgi:hypothetical protein
MRLTVFGGTGPTGMLLVQQALVAGHDVTAYARNPDKFTLTDPSLSIVAGELTDATAIKTVVHDADAVLSVLGPSSTRVPGTPITNGMVTIISAMKAHGVRRLVASATLSVSDPGDVPPWTVRAMVTGVRLFAPRPCLDIVGTGDAVRDSGLAWTLARVGLLRDGPHTANVRAGYLGARGKLDISRANFADFILRQVTDRDWIGKAPAISDKTA